MSGKGRIFMRSVEFRGSSQSGHSQAAEVGADLIGAIPSLPA
jgi:hypothetical protein